MNVMAAGPSGAYSTVRTGIETGGRPVGSDGLQTFGGVRALARYVKIEVVPASGGSVVINEASVVLSAGGAVAMSSCVMVSLQLIVAVVFRSRCMYNVQPNRCGVGVLATIGELSPRLGRRRLFHGRCLMKKTIRSWTLARTCRGLYEIFVRSLHISG